MMMPFQIEHGGVSILAFGWTIGCILYSIVISSIAEIASSIPLSGGTYQWTGMLSTKNSSAFLSYMVGYLSLVANVTIDACFSMFLF